MKAITDAEFDREIGRSSQPAIVHFHVALDDQCLKMTAILKRIEEAYPGWIRMMSLNIDENPVIANRYRARKGPVVMLFKGGSVELSMAGIVPEKRLLSILERHV